MSAVAFGSQSGKLALADLCLEMIRCDYLQSTASCVAMSCNGPACGQDALQAPQWHVAPAAGFDPPFALEKGTNGLSMESFRFSVRTQFTSHLCCRKALKSPVDAPW